MFQIFKTKVEKGTGTNILGLRTDRDGEFTSIELLSSAQIMEYIDNSLQPTHHRKTE